MSKTTYAAITILGAIVVIGATLFASSSWQASDEQPAGAPSVPETPGETTSVKVALLDYSGESGGKQRGCDRVVMVDRTIAATQAPLTAALVELFDNVPESVGEYSSFMPKTAATLQFDSATVLGGVARIYLTGSLSGLAGVCDDPRAKIQIEETALQFPTVQSVELYLNGELTELQPNEQG
jgi:hypothetical protein